MNIPEALDWLAGLEKNARTVNDGHGLPLAEKCAEARALLTTLNGAAMQRAFEATPDELGRAAVAQAALLSSDRAVKEPDYECPVCGVKASEAQEVAASCEEAAESAERNPRELVPIYERLAKTFTERASTLAAEGLVSSPASQPPQHVIDFGVEVAQWSPCQSKRGVVIFSGDDILGHGYNYKPRGFDCDGSDACKATCRSEAIHAEQQALLGFRNKAQGADMLHVKSVNGALVASGGPSCVQCSKLALVCGISGFWLFHESGWRRYDCAEFHRLSIEASTDGAEVSSPARQDGDCPLGPNHQHAFTLWEGQQCEHCMQTQEEISKQIARHAEVAGDTRAAAGAGDGGSRAASLQRTPEHDANRRQSLDVSSPARPKIALADDIIEQAQRRYAGSGPLPTKGSTTVYADAQMVLAALAEGAVSAAPLGDGGTWAKDDPRRIFVEGAKWWHWRETGATMFPSERDRAEQEAEERFPAS